jgi:hypothetical protein
VRKGHFPSTTIASDAETPVLRQTCHSGVRWGKSTIFIAEIRNCMQKVDACI